MVTHMRIDEKQGKTVVQRVLVVDDEPGITTTLSLILRAEGFQVETANSGPEALEVAQRFGPDALITDYAMPEMNGLELATELLKLFPACRIIVFTGYSRLPASSLPGYRLLSKPVPPNKFLEALNAGTPENRAQPPRPPRVLCIDDVDSHRYSVARLMRLAGFDVAERATGGDALEAAAEEADVILLDIGLPDLDGFEVCRLLKKRHETSSIPVIHITASHRDEVARSQSENAGAYDYIPEPFDPDHLLKQVRSALQLRFLQLSNTA